MRIGIFFGGPAREREISYAGGKTAYENIDKTLFTPVLVFVDSLGNFILDLRFVMVALKCILSRCSSSWLHKKLRH